MKEKERLAYLDKDKAEEERVKGNELFTQGNVFFCRCYTDAPKNWPVLNFAVPEICTR